MKKTGWNEKKCICIAMIVLLLLGAVLVRDYGITYDENTEVGIARMCMKEYVRVIFGEDSGIFRFMDDKIGDLMDSVEIDHGEALIYPAIAVVSVVRELGHAEWGMWFLHYYLWVWFCIGLLCLYLTGKYLTGKKRWGAAAALMLFLHPRFFSEAFFNNKDVLMLSATCVCIWFGILFVERRNWKMSVLWGISVGFCTNLRIIGGLYGAVFGCVYLAEYIRDGWKDYRRLRAGIAAILSMIVTFLLITPATWYGIGDYVAYTLGNAAGFSRWDSWILYMGELYNFHARPLPWHYLLVYAGITMPIGILAAVLCGQGGLIYQIGAALKDRDAQTERRKYAFVFGAIIWIPMLFFIIRGSNVYNGWRHFYFIYPSMILLGVMALHLIEEKQSRGKKALWALLMLQGVFCIGLLVIGHPLQFTYFNCLAGSEVEENYELDIWNIAFVHAVEQILEKDDSEHIVLSTDEWNSYYGIKMACEVLPEKDRSRVEFAEPETEENRTADYHLYSCTYVGLNDKMVEAGIAEGELWTPPAGFEKYFSVGAYGRDVIDIYRNTEL